MKLIDKIQKAHSNKPTDYSRVYNPTAEIIEQIADEFAIGFAEWNSYKYKYLPNKGWFRGSYELEMDIFKTSNELLEIYKKERNL